MNIGIFGGSFNPIHIGHLALANYLCEYEGLDEIWFLVSPHNPLKKRQDLWSDEFRLQLVEKAVKDYDKFRASDFEFNLPKPSYMVNTLRALRQTYTGKEFTLIIGSDNWGIFPNWYKHDEILNENNIIIYPRPGYPIAQESLPDGVHITQSPMLDISSTFIRQALADGKDVRYFLPYGIWNELSNTPCQL